MNCPPADPKDRDALEAGWAALVEIGFDEYDQLPKPFRCLNAVFQKGSYKDEVYLWFETNGFCVDNRINGINPFHKDGIKPLVITENECDAIIINGKSRIYIWLYMRDLDAMVLTVSGEHVKIDYVKYDKVLATVKTCIDKKLDVRIKPWMLDEVRLIQTPEENIK